MRLVNADPLPIEVDHPAVIDALAELEEGDRVNGIDQPFSPKIKQLKSTADALPFDEDIWHPGRLRLVSLNSSSP